MMITMTTKIMIKKHCSTHVGCWFVIDHCPNHPEAEGTHKDDTGTRAGTQEGCLARAGPQWQWCGSPDNGRVVSVYGPTGKDLWRQTVGRRAWETKSRIEKQTQLERLYGDRLLEGGDSVACETQFSRTERQTRVIREALLRQTLGRRLSFLGWRGRQS